MRIWTECLRYWMNQREEKIEMGEKNLNFDKMTKRTGTGSLKYDFALERGKPADVLPL